MPQTERQTVRLYVAGLDARRRTLAIEIEDDVALVRDLTLQQRGEQIANLCSSAWSILRARPDFATIVRDKELPAPDLLARWTLLMQRRRQQAEPGS